MLALDNTIGCMEVSESEVLDLYRSAPITRTYEKRSETMEAYICAIKKKAPVKVYLALVVNDHRIYVYSSPGKGKNEQEYPEEIAKALDCAKAMGFSPERIDLSYSPAMREVVVRNTKVLRLAGSKGSGGLKHGLAGAPILPIVKKSPVDIPEPVTAPPAPTTTPSSAPAAPLRAPAAQKDGGDAVIALAQLHQEQRALVAERDALSQQLRHLSAQHQEAASQLTAARQRAEELAGDRDQLRSHQRRSEELLAAKDTSIAELQKQSADLRLELETLAGRHAELSREQEAMVENLARARQDIARLTAERDAAIEGAGAATKQHREAAGLLEEARKEAGRTAEAATQGSRRIEVLEEAAQSLEKELASLRQELAGVTSDRDAALQRLAAQEEKGSAGTDLDRLRQELERVCAERDAAVARLNAAEERQPTEAEVEQAGSREELERLKSERDDALARAAALEEELEAVRSEGSRREADRILVQQEKPEAPEETTSAAALYGSVGETAGPDEEPCTGRILPGLQDSVSESLPAFTESMLPPFDELQVPPQIGYPLDAADATPPPAPAKTGGDFFFGGQDTAFLPLGDLQDSFFSAAGEGEPVRFLLETSLNAIDCPTADDVLELHHSINNAYLSPEGTGGQESCLGYVCCLRKGESKEVFAAIYGTTSHKTRVYLPETQPQDDESYARTVRGAISFAEEVGLMMERVPLEATGQKRQDSLKRCPALRMAEAK
ncbi:hypothetical protein KP001_11765 [Geomonas subterranea]|uniref:Chromosome segregation ATPase n=1 Tax=Geomonas subterranea TaxID=2847989 RepID=A0ABX8LBU6_9BACT|nr:hypothetical protein [Geomonas subterranea]QXE89143.1 hypothetical protein KP001_11765 [Geomonas subterranea]QXM08740.1 hypothetical protein KP002_17510 [Geomonas subterranea]